MTILSPIMSTKWGKQTTKKKKRRGVKTNWRSSHGRCKNNRGKQVKKIEKIGKQMAVLSPKMSRMPMKVFSAPFPSLSVSMPDGTSKTTLIFQLIHANSWRYMCFSSARRLSFACSFSEAMSSQVESSQVESSQVKSSQAKSTQGKSTQGKSTHLKSSQIKSSKTKSTQVESSKIKSSHVKSQALKSEASNEQIEQSRANRSKAKQRE